MQVLHSPDPPHPASWPECRNCGLQTLAVLQDGPPGFPRVGRTACRHSPCPRTGSAALPSWLAWPRNRWSQTSTDPAQERKTWSCVSNPEKLASWFRAECPQILKPLLVPSTWALIRELSEIGTDCPFTIIQACQFPPSFCLHTVSCCCCSPQELGHSVQRPRCCDSASWPSYWPHWRQTCRHTS